MIHRAESPDLTFLFNHGTDSTPPLNLIFNAAGAFQWELNSFLTKVGGGSNSYGARPAYATVSGYATALNVFQRFLDSNNKTLLEVDDDLLHEFTSELQRQNKANNSTIRRTVRRVLLALEHTQNENPFHKLFTLDFRLGEFQAHATEHYYARANTRYLSHACIDSLKPAPIHHITFIRSAQIEAWHSAIDDYSEDPYVRERWYIFSLLLEHTGSRISEVLEIPASAILKAYNSLSLTDKEGTIESIPVLKGKYKGAFRKILIPRADLQEIYKFTLRTQKQFPLSTINDKIFINSKNGQPLSRDTFNSYYSKVIDSHNRNPELLGISHHNFRHRYFTILVAKNIANQSKGAGTNRLDIAMGAGIKDSMHATKNTLATYVHLSEDPDIKKAIASTDAGTSSKVEKIKQLRASFEAGQIRDEIFDAVLKILKD